MRDSGRPFALLLASACLFAACAGCADAPADPDPTGGQWYHAKLISDEGEQVPFFLRIPDDCDVETATIVNGEERIAAPCERREAALATVVIDFPVYATRIEANVEPNGVLTGDFSREQPRDTQRLMGFLGRPIDEPDPRIRFSPVAAAGERAPDNEATERADSVNGADEGGADTEEAVMRAADADRADTEEAVVRTADADRADTGTAGTSEPGTSVAGIWRMEFDLYGTSKGVFKQDEYGVVTGTIDVPSDYGDMRFLAGNLRGRSLKLSTFDGMHTFLIEAELLPDGSMEGFWIRRDDSWDLFAAERSADFEAPDPLDRIGMMPGRETLDLEHLRTARYAGKPVIVELFGTWCPNCNDHTPALVELYERHHDAGLEILGLAFEHSDDQAFKEQRVREFRRRHGVEWEIVIVDWSLRDLAESEFGGLTRIEGVPVTIFVNRDGTVHAVYTGFSGPATGDSHLEAKARLDRLTREILEGG